MFGRGIPKGRSPGQVLFSGTDTAATDQNSMSPTVSTELNQLESLAEIDGLLRRLQAFAGSKASWEPLARGQALVARLLGRTETLRSRLQAPLVVATFGGTGTGKSALVNALVGQECTASGRQRPTTTRPILIVHPETDLRHLGLPLDSFEISRVAAPVLRDLVILDCPDPDTNEAETAGSNLALLHGLLPWCDVLLYVSTQQKYRSARVTAELVQAAVGCRLVFVQTNADLDTDIRDDWRQQLANHYTVPEIFFIDSLRALREQQASQPLTGDFARLRDLLMAELAAGRRGQIRRANLLDLTTSTLERCQQYVEEESPALSRLEQTLGAQAQKQVDLMSRKLQDELLSARQLWERRLVQEVATRWSLTPFSSVLRVYNSLGTLLASASFLRARSSVQLALLGALQGARWIHARREEQQTEARIEQVAELGLDDNLLRENQLVLTGFVRDAGMDPALVQTTDLGQLRAQAQAVEGQFLGSAVAGIDAIIDELATRNSGLWPRIAYEGVLGLLLAYVVGWPAYNFFIAHPFLDKPLISSDFYIHGLVFVVIVSTVLVMLFTSRLRGGLVERVSSLARSLAQQKMARGLFPRLEDACRETLAGREQLAGLLAESAAMRRELPGNSSLGFSART